MAQTTIQPEHLPQLARWQHVLEFLQAEQQRLVNEAQRLAIELQAVERHGAQKQAELTAFLRGACGFDAQTTPYTLDVEQGVITTPDIPHAPEQLQQQTPTSE